MYYLIGSEKSELTVSDTTTVVENKLGEISYLSNEIQYYNVLLLSYGDRSEKLSIAFLLYCFQITITVTS